MKKTLRLALIFTLGFLSQWSLSAEKLPTSLLQESTVVSHEFDSFFQKSHTTKASHDEYVVILGNKNDIQKDTFATITFLAAKNSGSYVPAGSYTIQTGQKVGSVNPGDINDSFDFVGAWYNTKVNGEVVYYQLQTGTVTVSYDENNASKIHISIQAQGQDYLKETPVSVDLTCDYILAGNMAYDTESRDPIIYNEAIVDFKYYRYDSNNADKDTFELALANQELVMNLDVIVAAGSELLAGEYPINPTCAVNTTVASKGLHKGVMTSSMAKISDGKGNYTPYYFVDGKLTVSYTDKGTPQEEMHIQVEALSYFDSQFNVDAIHKVADEPYAFEPKQTKQFELEMGQAQVTKKAESSDTQTYELLFSDKEGKSQSVVLLYSSKVNSGKDAENGTYHFSSTQTPLNAQVSQGMLNNAPTGSFMMTDFNSKGYAQTAYFMTSGTVVVSDDTAHGSGKLYEVTATTYFGSTIHFIASSWVDLDIPYVAEPKEKITIDYTPTEFKLTRDTYKKLVFVLEMNTTQYEGKLLVFPKGDAQELADGNYPLALSGAENTVQKSRGGAYIEAVGTYVDDPSYVKVLGGDRKVYYFEIGNLKISTPKVGQRLYEVTMTSHFGSTIRISYLKTSTGVDRVESATIYSIEGHSLIVNAEHSVVIYDLDGKVIVRELNVNGRLRLDDLESNRIYVLAVDGKTYKVAL